MTCQILIENYLKELNLILAELPIDMLVKISVAVRKAREEKRHIFIFGNGGSAATASHMACDFGKNTVNENNHRIRVISLNDSIPTLLAYANDNGYEVVFAEQLKSLAEPGDLVIAISGSGNSPNILNGVQAAQTMGLQTIGLTGSGGGKLKDLVDLCLIVPSHKIEQVEDVHMIIDHVLTMILRQE
jgi:D-sedoheptulose 7-phosphate isomerase